MEFSYDELKERHNDLLARYDSMTQAAGKNQEEIGRLAGENSILKNDVIRLSEEARLSQQNAQLLGDDFNGRSQVLNKQVTILRARLRDNGLNTEVD